MRFQTPYLHLRGSVTIETSAHVCITTYQPDTKSNPNPNPNPKPTTKQHAIVNIQLNISRPTYPDKFIRDNVVAPWLLVSIAIVTLPTLRIDPSRGLSSQTPFSALLLKIPHCVPANPPPL